MRSRDHRRMVSVIIKDGSPISCAMNSSKDFTCRASVNGKTREFKAGSGIYIPGQIVPQAREPFTFVPERSMKCTSETGANINTFTCTYHVPVKP